MCKLSVLIPVYNVEQYLRQCLDSVVNQTLEGIEIICVDDGSKDKSGAILDEYAQEYSHLKVIHKDNSGYGRTMNTALKVATGDYVGIVESDDFVDLRMFECLYKTAKKVQVPLVRSNYIAERDGEAIFCELLQGLPYNEIVSPMHIEGLFYKLATIWAAIYERDFLLRNDIWFNETPGASYQDVSFCFKVLAAAEKIYLVKDAFLHYRMDNPNSSVKSKAKVYCIFDEFQEIDRFLAAKQDVAPEIKYIEYYLKYRKCMESFHRIDKQYKRDFLYRMSEEFKKSNENGLLKAEYWTDKKDWEHVHDIISRPDKVLYEDFLYRQMLRAYRKAFEHELFEKQKVYVYGAGQVGRKTLKFLKRNGIIVAGILVSSMEGNPRSLLGVEVRAVDTISPTSDCTVLIAIREQDQYEVLPRLEGLGWKHIIALDRTTREALQI